MILSSYCQNAVSRHLGIVVSEWLGPDATVHRVSFSPFDGIEMQGVEFRDNHGPFLEMGKITLKYAFRPLLSKQFHFKNVLIQNVRAYQRGEGQFSPRGPLSSLLAQEQEDPPAGFRVRMDDTIFCFRNVRVYFPSPAGDEERVLALDFCLDRQGQQYEGKGIVRTRASSWLRPILPKYQSAIHDIKIGIDVEGVQKDILVNKISMTSGPFSVAGSGIIRDYPDNTFTDIRLHSDPVPMELVPAFKAFLPITGDINFLGYLTGPLQRLNLKVEVVMPAAIFTIYK